MVRGSGSESGDKESNNKSIYCGTLTRWPQGSLKLKASLYMKGLWAVVEKGIATWWALYIGGNITSTGRER